MRSLSSHIGNCLCCDRRSVTTLFIIVDGIELMGIEREQNRMCLQCSYDRGGNSLTHDEYRAFIALRDVRNESHWDMVHSGTYVLIRYGAVSSFMAFRETLLNEWRLNALTDVSETQVTYTLIGKYTHLHECRTAAVEYIAERFANGHQV